jgi:hypothetical protein
MLGERLRVFLPCKAEHPDSLSSRLSEYGRGAAEQVPAKLQTIWLFITPRTLSADSATWCGQWRLISGSVISPLRLVIAALPPTGATYQPSIPQRSSQSL